MQSSDSNRFLELMTRMGEIFQRDVTPILVDEYFKALQDYPLRRIAWAVEECIKDCLFFPKPREIIQAIQAEPPPTYHPALPEKTDENIRKECLAKIYAMCDGIAAKQAMPKEDPDFQKYLAIGREMIDQGGIDRAMKQAVRDARQRREAKDRQRDKLSRGGR